MLHQLSSYNFGTLSAMDVYHQEILAVQKVMNELIAHHTGQPLEKVIEDVKHDKWMSAEEALEYGIVDEIVGKPRVR